MSNRRSWSRFSDYDNTVDEATLQRIAVDNWVSHSVPSPASQRDVVLQIAEHARVPVAIEAVPDVLADTKLIRGRVVFESLGDALDKMALNYSGMYWWLTDRGVNMSIVEPLHIRLGKRLESEVATLPPQERGYAFEKFLDTLFSISGLSPRKSFRLKGEQIDGSFQLDHTTYLVEAKWQKELTDNRDLQGFAGVVASKATWARGLFISYSGFSDEGIYAFERGAKPLICMSGDELRFILANDLKLGHVLLLKARHAAETGQVFISVEKLIKLS
jgi:Restriction endonuclease